MKITHISLVAYIDGWGYQDNLLPEYQAKEQHDVTVITSINHFPSYVKKDTIQKLKTKGPNYLFKNVHIKRIKTYLNTSSHSFYIKGLYKSLRETNPDLIFHHGVSFTSLLIVLWYKLRHKNVVVMVDNHADEINQTSNVLWNVVYNKIILRTLCFFISPWIKNFYGVTNLRCDYLNKVFGIRKQKIKLLPIGGDTDLVESLLATKAELRLKYNILEDAFVIVTGGKMGKYKGTDTLIEVYRDLKRQNPKLHLILFGEFEDTATEAMARECDTIHLLGWCDRLKTIELLLLADVAIWPIHHTTLIEDAVACATPLILRETGNTQHLIDHNGILIKEGSVEEIKNALLFTMNSHRYLSLKSSAERMKQKYSYKTISEMIIHDFNEKP